MFYLMMHSTHFIYGYMAADYLGGGGTSVAQWCKCLTDAQSIQD